MPFIGNHAGDVALELPEGPVCTFDVINGMLKTPEEIFAGGVEFFATAATGGDHELAERLTRRNMKALPYWRARPFDKLSGLEATTEEFESAIAAL